MAVRTKEDEFVDGVLEVISHMTAYDHHPERIVIDPEVPVWMCWGRKANDGLYELAINEESWKAAKARYPTTGYMLWGLPVSAPESRGIQLKRELFAALRSGDIQAHSPEGSDTLNDVLVYLIESTND